MNGAYHVLDLVPKGRNEANLTYPWNGCTGTTRYED